MEHWGPWDWIAYGSLAAGAVILAFETGLSQSPTISARLRIVRHPYWNFAPVLFVLLATGIFVWRGLFSHEPAGEPHEAAIKTDLPDPSKIFLQSWGLFPPATYQVTINAAQLSQYRANYRLLLIVRTGFTDVDRMTDEFIELSNAYTIEDNLMVLAHPSSNKLRFLLQNPTLIEYDVVVIPNGVSEKSIATLKSVSDVGGKIIASATQIVSPKASATSASKSKFCEVLSC